jgi:acyl-coenzyme A synthetase/AMP-(fatty) acid ligase
MKDFMIMFLIMFTAGLLSTMNVWVTKTSDIRFSLNDVYMALLMTGWMFFIMGLYYQYTTPLFFGLSLILFSVWLIRTQQLINLTQYKLGMIPHHSMAIHMSKKLLEKNPPNEQFLLNLIHTQEKEIEYLKSL